MGDLPLSPSILPESPRWLISKGRYDAAEKVFREIASTNETVFDSIAYERLIHEEKKVRHRSCCFGKTRNIWWMVSEPFSRSDFSTIAK